MESPRVEPTHTQTNVFIFPSKSTLNIYHAIKHKKWAVTKVSDREQSKRLGRARAMYVGSYGLFYDEERQSITVPFIVASDVDPSNIIVGLWEGEWYLPFTILPLGTIEKFLHKDQLKEKLPTIIRSEKTWDKLLNFRGLTVFSPSKLMFEDWQTLLKLLCP